MTPRKDVAGVVCRAHVTPGIDVTNTTTTESMRPIKKLRGGRPGTEPPDSRFVGELNAQRVAATATFA